MHTADYMATLERSYAMECMDCHEACDDRFPLMEAAGNTTYSSGRLAGYLCEECYADTTETEDSLWAIQLCAA